MSRMMQRRICVKVVPPVSHLPPRMPASLSETPGAACPSLRPAMVGVLPTGRNIHALDPYRMPSTAALQRGTAAAMGILDAHREANAGTLPVLPHQRSHPQQFPPRTAEG